MRVGKATLKVFGKVHQYMGPGNRWEFPGGWISESSHDWIVWSFGCSAKGQSPELAVRRLHQRALKIVEAIG